MFFLLVTMDFMEAAVLAMLGMDRRLIAGKPEGCVVILPPRIGDWETDLCLLETLQTGTAGSASASHNTCMYTAEVAHGSRKQHAM